MIKARIQPGKESEAEAIAQEFEDQSRREGIGPVRVHVFANQSDPLERYTLAIFESEEKAREAENNPKQAELIKKFWGVYEANPEYADLVPVIEWSR
jgi:quinol monooxygenase YgiN